MTTIAPDPGRNGESRSRQPTRSGRRRTDRGRLRVWIDIENPPQVQYLLPFKAAFETNGTEVVITARDYGVTVDLLHASGTVPSVFGVRTGHGNIRKLAATIGRARDLNRFFAERGKPDVLLAVSRASGLAAWKMRIPSFGISDYEYASTTISRLTGSILLYPDVIEHETLLQRGLRSRQLVPFRGLKEDLTFAGVDIDAAEPYRLPPYADGAVRVLFRPPSETSHYYSAASTRLARATLAHLAHEGVVIVFAPREPNQVALLEGLQFAYEPVVLRAPVNFVSLLKGVDAVVCAGGTMLREAAYLGIPTYSIFQSKIGAVDRWLEQIGRARLLHGPQDLGQIKIRQRPPLHRLDSNPHLLEELVSTVIGRSCAEPVV